MTAEVSIRFCPTCGFGEAAERIAQAVRRELSLSVECQPAFWGTFRIERQGQEIFNRWKTRGWLGRLGCGRTPTPEEIVELLRSSASQATS